VAKQLNNLALICQNQAKYDEVSSKLYLQCFDGCDVEMGEVVWIWT